MGNLVVGNLLSILLHHLNKCQSLLSASGTEGVQRPASMSTQLLTWVLVSRVAFWHPMLAGPPPRRLLARGLPYAAQL